MRIDPIIPIWALCIIVAVMLLCMRRGIINYIRQFIIIALVCVIGLRPYKFIDNVKQVSRNIDVLFVVDNTISMVAEDYDGKNQRIDGVKANLNYIIEQLPGAKFSIITYANECERLVPYTSDINAVNQAIMTLGNTTSYYAQGTTINMARPEMKLALDRESDAVQLVFFLSDGEITKNGQLDSFAELSKFIDGGAVLGYGTDKGGRMKVESYTGSGEKEYITYYDDDFNNIDAISKIDEKNLNKLSSDLGIEYVHITEDKDIEPVVARAVKLAEDAEIITDDEEGMGKKEYYYYFAWPLILLLVVDFVYYRRRLR